MLWFLDAISLQVGRPVVKLGWLVKCFIFFSYWGSVSLTQILNSLWPKINWHQSLLYDSRVHLKLGMWARSKSISDCFDSLVSAGGSLWYARQAETLCQEPQECPPLRHWGPSYWAIEPSNHHLMELLWEATIYNFRTWSLIRGWEGTSVTTSPPS